MQPVLVVAFAAAMLFANQASLGPVSNAGIRLWAAFLGVVLVVGCAVGSAAVTIRELADHDTNAQHSLQRFRRLRRLHAALWFAVSAGILYGLNWPQLVRFNWGLDAVPLADDLMILLPLLLPLVLSWAAFFDVECSVGVSCFNAPGSAEHGLTRRQYVGMLVRCELGLLLGPLLAIATICDLERMVAPTWFVQQYHERVLALSLIALLIGFPWFLKAAWGLRALPQGPLRRRLLQAGCRWKFIPQDLLVWNTHGRVANALVTGLAPRFSFVLFTDVLLSRFDEAQIEAVFAHEVGHQRRHHLVLRLLVLTAPVMTYFACQSVLVNATAGMAVWLPLVFVSESAILDAVAGAGYLAYVGIFVGWYARQLEHQADLFAVRAVGPAPYEDALNKLRHENGNRDRRTWLHPSIASRIALVRQLSIDPIARRRRSAAMMVLHAIVLIWAAVAVTALFLSP